MTMHRTRNSRRRTRWIGASLLFVAGCPQDPGGSDTDVAPSTGASSGDGEPSTSVGEGSTAGAESATTAGVETTTAGVDTTTAGVDTTTGDGDTTTGDGDTEGTTGDPTGGDGDGEFPCCEQGCSARLFQTLVHDVTVSHAGARMTTHDGAVLLLWDSASLELIGRYATSDAKPLVGDRLLYSAGDLHLIDTSDGSELGVMPGGSSWGVALDGGYVWAADDQGLRVYDPDGTPRWSVAGAFAGLTARATADTLSVFDKDVAPLTMQRFAAADGALTTSAFVGVTLSFFADSGRFFTLKDKVYRFYDEAGALLFSGMDGYPLHGWGTRYVFGGMGGNDIRDIAAPDVPLASVNSTLWKMVGPHVLTRGQSDDHVFVTRLDVDPIPPPELIDLPDGFHNGLTFALAGDAWVAGSEDGQSLDHMGRRPSRGPISGTAGASTGRAMVSLGDEKFPLDIAADCGLGMHPAIENGSANMRLADDGGTLISAEVFSVNWMVSARYGTRIYSLPDGEKLYEVNVGLHDDIIADHDISDAGTIWSRLWASPPLPGHAHVETVPVDLGIVSKTSDVLPKIAPGGGHVVVSEGVSDDLDDWVDDPSSIWVGDPQVDDPIATFVGIAEGFIDDEHILVASYVDPDETFAGMRIVGLDGLDVQDTPLPEIRRIFRVGTGEILALDMETQLWTIFDPWTGTALWTAPPGVEAAVAGEDFVLLNRGDHVEVTLWR